MKFGVVQYAFIKGYKNTKDIVLFRNPQTKRLTTKEGATILSSATREPKTGEFYLKPSGVKNTFNLLVAQNNFDSKCYMIVEGFDTKAGKDVTSSI